MGAVLPICFGVIMQIPNNDTKILIGYGIGGLVSLSTIACAFVGGESWPLQVTLCFLGGAVGWTVGIVLSPLDEEEGTRFGSMSKAFVALFSGFTIAKLEEPIVQGVRVALEQDGHLYSFRICLFMTLFVIGFLFTLISRLYSEDAALRRSKRQARLLAEAENLLLKYQTLKSED